MASFSETVEDCPEYKILFGRSNSQPDDEKGSYFAGLTKALLGAFQFQHGVIQFQHMHKVPERFRKGNEEFYRPRVVAIGPYHDIDAHFRCADIKVEYGLAFADRYGLSDTIELRRRLGEGASGYYYLEQIPRDLGTMMLVDGLFLLELMLRSRFPEYRKAGDDDPIFNSTRIIVDACRDILLIDNQLPSIVLQELYQQCVVPHPRPEHVSLRQLALHFFNAHLFDNNNIPPTPPDGDEFQFDHLVAFVRSFYSRRPKSSRSPSASDGGTSNQFHQHSIMRNLVAWVRSFYSPRKKSSLPLSPYKSCRSPSASDVDTSIQLDQHSIMRNLVAWVRSFHSPREKNSRSLSASDGDTSNNVNDTNITVQLIPPSVSKLYEAGVKLDKLFSASSGLNIEFDKGLLKIPHPDYWTGTFFLNVIVYEENEYLLPPSGKYVSQFMFFMGWMIRTSKDVDILIENGIISSMLGSNTDLVALFDRISKMGWPHDYYDLCQELNDYCTSSPWHKWKATLKRDYFDTPWKIASTIAAVILLLLTLMQTVCSFLSLKP